MKGNGISRRDFLRAVGWGTLGAVILVGTRPGLLRNVVRGEDAAKSTIEVGPSQYDWEKHYWAFVVDSRRCIGCGRCVAACKVENRVPGQPEYNRTWVERYVISDKGEVFIDSPEGGVAGFTAEHVNIKYRNLNIAKSCFVPRLCNQCDNPPCVNICPVRATYMTKDGIILIDQKRCVGCGYCVAACPYGARYMVPAGGETPTGQEGVADKCTWCYHRITKGLQPACIEACPVGARIFGDLRDDESPVSKILREERVDVLKPALGTIPKVYYLGLERYVR